MRPPVASSAGESRNFLVGAVLLMAALFAASPGFAHESRPALLNITEIELGVYSAVWRVPAKGQVKLKLNPAFSDGCVVRSRSNPLSTGNASVEWLELDCRPAGLAGKRIHIEGLQATITDVYLRVESIDGPLISTTIRPQQPSYRIPDQPGKFAVMINYWQLGVDHIAGGIDHLLFVLGLMLLISSFRSLLITVTSFTVAHSITLTCVVLGVVPQPGPAIESIIALSIVFLAYEGLRQKQGLTSITIRYPWIAAFAFGLLHGFGFAGALAEIGLPASDIPLALLFFNLGIETGQVIFVAVLALLVIPVRRASLVFYRRGTTASSWCIGVIASYWLFERLSLVMTASY